MFPRIPPNVTYQIVFVFLIIKRISRGTSDVAPIIKKIAKIINAEYAIPYSCPKNILNISFEKSRIRTKPKEFMRRIQRIVVLKIFLNSSLFS